MATKTRVSCRVCQADTTLRRFFGYYEPGAQSLRLVGIATFDCPNGHDPPRVRIDAPLPTTDFDQKAIADYIHRAALLTE